MKHPAWCDRTHEIRCHRGVVGQVLIGDTYVEVILLQVADGEPTAHISGTGFSSVGIDTMDVDAAAALMDVLGHPELAALVRRAAEVLTEPAGVA